MSARGPAAPLSSDGGGQAVRAASPWELRLYRVCWLIAVGLSRAVFPGGVVGREHVPPSGPYIVAPVHRSYLDWLIVVRITRRRVRFMAKAELWHSRAAGRLLEALGAFPVNRSGADREALKRSRAVLAGREPLVLFPEGTRRSGPRVEGVYEGVAYLSLSAGVPVVPVGIGGGERAMPRGARLPRPGRIEVVVGPALDPGPVLGTGGDGTATRRARVSRSATRELSAMVTAAVQSAFDEAESRAQRGSLLRRLGRG